MSKQINNKIKETNIFKSSNFFMIRTPLFPVDIYTKTFCESSLSLDKEEIFNLVKNNNIIKEAILVSSLSLYNELENISKVKDNRKKEQVLSSLVKYIIRMTTRTTPFGLFSGITRGSFDELIEIKIKDNKENIKRARPDMEWLYAVIRGVESDEKILNDMHITKNDLAVINGSRIEIGYISNYGQTMKEDNLDNITASIRYTNQVKKVMELTEIPIKYKDLLSIFKANNPEVELERIKIFLNQLMTNEYLITEMRPPLASIDPFEYILSKLRNIEPANNIYNSLNEIKLLIDEYNKLSIGDGEELYLDIIEKMKSFHECKNYLQIDMSTAIEEATLDKSIALEIEKIAELAFKFSQDKPRYDYLGDYLNDFLEVYGEDREIQLLELLDEDKGLGAPAGYTKPRSHRQMKYSPINRETKKIQSFLSNKVLRAIMANEEEIIITDEEIEKNQTKYTLNDIPNSLEIYTLLSHSNKNGEEDFTVHLGPNYGSHIAGKSFGRFIDIMSEKVKADFIELEKEQEGLYGEDTIVAEIVELPQSGRLSNVALNWNPREYELIISTNGSNDKNKINIEDLYIGVDNQNNKRTFYIKSKSLNKRVILKVNNMLNITLCSNIYRFLHEISTMQERSILSSLYEIFAQCFKDMNFTPRIRYRKSIIYPTTWRLNNEILNLTKRKYSKEGFYKSMGKWKNDWKVPKFVYLQEGDNRLLLNLENKMHLNELYYILSKNVDNNITITEIEGEIEDRIAEGKDGKYLTEIVVPIIRNKNYGKENIEKKRVPALETKSNYKIRKRELSSLDIKRTFFPGDEWLSLKLYGNSKRVEELIGFHLMSFCQQLINQKEIDKFFFLRYADPEGHIRLRLKGTKDNIQQKVIPKVNLWFKQLIEEGMLNIAIIDTYKREVERYGGLELIELAEDVFYTDSIFTCNVINLMRNSKSGMPLEVYIVASIINMMEELRIDYRVQKELFSSYFDKSLHRELFQKHRKTFLSICNSHDDWNGLKKTEHGRVIYNLFNLRKESLNDFGDRVVELDNEGKLWNDKISILFSIIHMHCNRILDSRQKEELVMATVRHTLHALEYIKGNQEKGMAT